MFFHFSFYEGLLSSHNLRRDFNGVTKIALGESNMSLFKYFTKIHVIWYLKSCCLIYIKCLLVINYFLSLYIILRIKKK